MKKPKPIEAWGIVNKSTGRLQQKVYPTKKEAQWHWPYNSEHVRVRISVIEKAKRK